MLFDENVEKKLLCEIMEILHIVHYIEAFIISKYQSTFHMGNSNESVISPHLVKLEIKEYNNVEFLNHEVNINRFIQRNL